MKISVTVKVTGMRLLPYTVVCNDLLQVIKGEKLPLEIKRAVQPEVIQQVPDSEKINVYSKMVDVLSKGTPGMMKEAQEEDVDISKMMFYVKSGQKNNSCSDTKN